MSALLKYKTRFNMLSLRERLLVFVAVFGVLIAIWYFAFLGVMHQSKSTGTLAYDNLKQEVATLGKALDLARNKLEVVSKESMKLAKAAAQQKQGRTITLQDFLRQLIAPEKMHVLLRDLLSSQHGLKLLEFDNLPAKMIGTEGTQYLLFEHGIEIKIQGGYQAVIGYLQSLEKLEWGFYWDSLEYRVTKYPVAEVTLRLHTLSDKKDLINV